MKMGDFYFTAGVQEITDFKVSVFWPVEAKSFPFPALEFGKSR